MLTNEELDKKILEFKEFKEKEIKEKEEEKIINSKDPKAIYEFAKNIEGSHIDKLEDGIIATGDAVYINQFAFLDGAHIEKLEDAIIDTKAVLYICSFAINVKKGKDIDKLEDAIIAIGDAHYIYYFASDVKDTNIERLGNALIEIGNIEYITRFSILLKDISIDKFELKMILKKDYDLKTIYTHVLYSFLRKLYLERKIDTLNYLIKNREIDINEVRLRIYFDYLSSFNSTEEDLEKCNEEYIRYVSMFYGEKNKNEETKENSGTNNKQGKTLVKTKKING